MDRLVESLSVRLPGLDGRKRSIPLEGEQQVSAVTVQVRLFNSNGRRAWTRFVRHLACNATPVDQCGQVTAFRVTGLRDNLSALICHEFVQSVEWIEASLPAFGRVPMDEFGNRTDRAPAVPHEVRVKHQTQQRQAAAKSVAQLQSNWDAELIPDTEE